MAKAPVFFSSRLKPAQGIPKCSKPPPEGGGKQGHFEISLRSLPRGATADEVFAEEADGEKNYQHNGKIYGNSYVIGSI